MVTYDAGLISVLLWCMWRRRSSQGRFVFIFHFSQKWITHLVTHMKIKIQTLSGETVRMCRLAWSFAAHICDKYLNHKNWYINFGPSLHLHLLFKVPSAKAMARLRNVQPRQIIRCSHMWYFLRTGPNILAWAYIYIPYFFRDSLFAFAISTKHSWTGL